MSTEPEHQSVQPGELIRHVFPGVMGEWVSAAEHGHYVSKLKSELDESMAQWYARQNEVHGWRTRYEEALRMIDVLRRDCEKADAAIEEIEGIGQLVGCGHTEGLRTCVKEKIEGLEGMLVEARQQCARESLKHILTERELIDERDEARAELAKAQERLGPIDPGGSDKIDELECSIQFLRHTAEVAQERVKTLREALQFYAGAPWVSFSSNWAHSNLAKVAKDALAEVSTP